MLIGPESDRLGIRQRECCTANVEAVIGDGQVAEFAFQMQLRDVHLG